MLMKTNKSFRLVLIKPSHYDHDGYVIRWWRGGLPSNSLACLYGIALECRGRQVLGADFDIDIEAIDETNWKVRVEDLTRSIKAADAGIVMLVGVQSNQFPRSLDIAKQFRGRGNPGRDRWLPCVRHRFDVAGARSRRSGDDGPRRVGVRRRS